MLDSLVEILVEAGRMLLARRLSGDFTFRRSGVSVNASVDLEVHEFLAGSLAGLSAGIPVISEEDAAGRLGARPDEYWLIDPLDGTASFVDGFAGYVTQAALMRGARPVLAVVHAPSLEETFVAEVGAGAAKNGQPLRVREKGLDRCVITDNYPTPSGLVVDLMHSLGVPEYLECGSIGLKICRVADSSADLFVKDVTVRDWDLAAPQLVLEEAGGSISDGSGTRFPYAGGFEHRGLVAGGSAKVAARVVAWLRDGRDSRDRQ